MTTPNILRLFSLENQKVSEQQVQESNTNPSQVFPVNKDGEIVPEFNLVVADSAIMRIKFLQQRDPERYAVLKILVEGGGCSGFSYAFDVISEKEM